METAVSKEDKVIAIRLKVISYSIEVGVNLVRSFLKKLILKKIMKFIVLKILLKVAIN